MSAGVPNEGTFLDVRQAGEVWGRGIMQHLALAFRKRFAFASIAELKAAPTTGLSDNDDAAPNLASVNGATYSFVRFSSASPDDYDAVLPDDIEVTSTGRWLRTPLPYYANLVRNRYYEHVEYVDDRVQVFGPDKSGSLWDRCRGKTPALFVSCVGDEAENTSQVFAWHWFTATFRLRVLSANWRGGVSARFGSYDLAEELGDPGASRMIGDLRWYFISTNGVLTRVSDAGDVVQHRAGLLGLNEVRIGRRSLDEDRNERVISESLEIELRGSIWTPSEPGELLTPRAVFVQQYTDLGIPVADPFQVVVNE